MTEVPHAGEDHRDAVLVRRSNRLVVALTSAWLHNRRHAGSRERIGSVAKRKECVACRHCSARPLSCAGAGDACGIHTVLLTCTDSDGASIAREHDAFELVAAHVTHATVASRNWAAVGCTVPATCHEDVSADGAS